MGRQEEQVLEKEEIIFFPGDMIYIYISYECTNIIFIYLYIYIIKYASFCLALAVSVNLRYQGDRK